MLVCSPSTRHREASPGHHPSDGRALAVHQANPALGGPAGNGRRTTNEDQDQGAFASTRRTSRALSPSVPVPGSRRAQLGSGHPRPGEWKAPPAHTSSRAGLSLPTLPSEQLPWAVNDQVDAGGVGPVTLRRAGDCQLLGEELQGTLAGGGRAGLLRGKLAKLSKHLLRQGKTADAGRQVPAPTGPRRQSQARAGTPGVPCLLGQLCFIISLIQRSRGPPSPPPGSK